MIIDCISDLHGFHPKLDGGDLLIVAGDLTAKHTIQEHVQFILWLIDQKYEKKIVIAGNHDSVLVDKKTQKNIYSHLDSGSITYLSDSGTEFKGLKIWGTPWSLWFDGVNPKCKVFMGTEKDLKKKYDLVPNDIDILISHTPPYGILDENYYGLKCGSKSLLECLDRVKPKLLVFGHIHEEGGKKLLYKHEGPNTWCINASHVNENYKPINKPMRIIL